MNKILRNLQNYTKSLWTGCLPGSSLKKKILTAHTHTHAHTRTHTDARAQTHTRMPNNKYK